MGQLCKDLNQIIGQEIYYDTLEIQNTKWLWLVYNVVTAINNDKTLCFLQTICKFGCWYFQFSKTNRFLCYVVES